MEEKINLVELLKDCPKGMELDCTMYDNVSFVEVVDDDKYPIVIKTKSGFITKLTKYGHNIIMDDGKCVIFPKGKTTWKGFQRPFKDGDIVYTDFGSIVILKILPSIFYSSYCGLFSNVFNINISVSPVRFATEEEKQKLFDAIKINGYKWNEKTKTLEKLIEPKFKIGDRIKHKTNTRWVCTIARVADSYYLVDGHPTCFTIKFSEHDEYELVPNKLDINTLKPFDKVLVRQSVIGKWGIEFFGGYSGGFYYTTGNCMYAQCIPYEGNEYLLNTTNDCNDFYKTWK